MLSTITKQSIQWMGYVTGATTFLARNQGVSRIFMYHGVAGSELDIDSFRGHLDYLSKNFRVVSMDEMIQRLQDNSTTGSEVVLTFDDGLRNNYTNVYPILRKMKIPATFYVCPELITVGKWIWTLETRERLKFIDETKGSGFINELLEKADKSVNSSYKHEHIVEWLKTLVPRERREVFDLVVDQSAGYKPSDYDKAQNDLLSWDELRKIDTDLITIGSHTLTHPILTTLTPEELEQEVGKSKTILEDKLQIPVEYFSYPNGGNSEQVVEVVQRYYKSAVVAEYGYVRKEYDIYRLQRLPTTSAIHQFSWGMTKSR